MAAGSRRAAGPGDAAGVWRAFDARLRAFVARRVPAPADVDDVLQEIVLRVHRSLGSLRSAERLGPWLFRIARHAIADHHRAAAARAEAPAGLGSDLEPRRADRARRNDGPTPDDEAAAQARAELAGCLQPLMAGLAPEYREALILTDLDGATQRAAARRLGLSLPGMKSRVQRGRRQLRQLLEACCRIELDAMGRVMGYERRQPSDRSCPGQAPDWYSRGQALCAPCADQACSPR